MQAWQVRAWGEPEGMTLEDGAVPEPGAGEVRIANRAAALNFFDILQIQGKYQIKPPFPFTPFVMAAAALALSAAATPALSHDDSDSSYNRHARDHTAHYRFHREVNDAHRRAHEEGFYSGAEHRAYQHAS